MSRNNRKCVICQKEYSYCNSCDKNDQPTWKASFCDANCREVYHVCVEFKAGTLSKREALARINKCNLADFDNFTSSTKSIIREIQRVENNNQVKAFKRKK